VAAYCAAHGLALARVEADGGISAKTTRNRPGLRRALDALARGEVSGLVAVKLDRLSRTTRDVLDLVETAERERWALHTIDERLDTASPHGRFTVTILAALAQLEREQVAARTRAAMAELRRQGRRTSRHARFGYRLEGDRLVRVEEEQGLLARVLEMRERGLGARRIAAALNAGGGGNPRTGRPWNVGTLRAVLRTHDLRGPLPDGEAHGGAGGPQGAGGKRQSLPPDRAGLPQ
jgi:site-specific DNA recombinase